MASGFLVFKIIHMDNLNQVLLITYRLVTYLFLLLYSFVPPLYQHLSLLLLLLTLVVRHPLTMEHHTVGENGGVDSDVGRFYSSNVQCAVLELSIYRCVYIFTGMLK